MSINWTLLYSAFDFWSVGLESKECGLWSWNCRVWCNKTQCQDQYLTPCSLCTCNSRYSSQTLARAPNLLVCPPPEASDNLSYLCLLLLRFRERLVQACINKYTTFITLLLICWLGKPDKLK